ncbi:MAG: glucose 1-dehydrogenase [Bryobacteraceae bacterium]|jgi:NAD(P)-dependent dehydrogenase (short-subunit alcohol dehydrogenase family)
MRLSQKVAIVTGAGSGIGRATAELFAREGAAVVAADLNENEAVAVADAIKAAGGRAAPVCVDVSNAAQVRTMVESALRTFSRIDILFNGAGVLVFGTVLDLDEACWNRVMSINLTGVFLCCKEALPHMISTGGGSIINVSSTTGAHDANRNAAAYVASKGGVTLLTKCLALDHAGANVRVNAICPGPTDTPMLRKAMSRERLDAFAATYAMGRLGRPEEIAAAALFLASDESSFVTGITLFVDGGQTAAV